MNELISGVREISNCVSKYTYLLTSRPEPVELLSNNTDLVCIGFFTDNAQPFGYCIHCDCKVLAFGSW